MDTIERKLLQVDLRPAHKRSIVKACPTCGAGAPTVDLATSTHDDVALAFATRQDLERAGWELDLSHADTKRFNDVITFRASVIDLVFAIALTRAKP